MPTVATRFVLMVATHYWHPQYTKLLQKIKN